MIKLKNIVFEYESDNPETNNRALDNINLEIREGEYVSIMGHNNSGKTTLARCLNALFIPTQGDVIVDDMVTSNLDNISSIRRKVGMVFQNPENQIVSTTVEREIAFGLENLGVPTEIMHQVVNGTLIRFRLQQYQKHPPHLLSGGEKQRLALAAVMAMNPKYLILDEPTSMLDPQGRKELLDLLSEIKEDNRNKKTTDQVTLILITQFAEETLESDRLIIMDKGKIVFDDAPDIVFQNVEQLKKIDLEVPVEFEIGQILVEKGYSLEPLKDFR